MATVTHAVVTNVDTTNTPNSSTAFTPVVGDLLVVITGTSTSTSTALDGALTASANGLTFSALFTSLYDSSTDKLCVFVANQLVPASPSSMTVTWTPSDAGQQSIHSVFRIAGMTRTGLDAVRQFVANANNASGTAPSITFPSACLTGNPTILAVAVADSTPAFTAPTGWTETSDTGGTSPNGGLWDGFRNSGFTGTSVTWSTNAGGGYAEAGIEFDTTAPPGADPRRVAFFENDTASGGSTTLTSGAFAVLAGDLIVVKASVTGGGTIGTPTATGLTFTQRANATFDEVRPRAVIFTAVCPSNDTITVQSVFSANQKAFIVEQWRDMHLDASPATIVSFPATVPDASIATEAADSVVTWIVADWNESSDLTPTYDGDGTSITDFAEEYAGAWTWWAPHTYGLGAAGTKAISWSSPTSIDGNFAGLELLDGPADSSVTGTLAADLPALAAAVAGAVSASGTVSGTLPALTAALTGLSGDPATGTIAATLPALTAATAGIVAAMGTVTADLPALAAALAGSVTAGDITGTLGATLPEATGAATGALTVSGVLGGTLPTLVAAAAGTATATGTLAATVPAPTAAMAGTVEVPGVAGPLTAVLPQLAGSATATVSSGGTFAGIIPALTADLDGEVTVEAILAAALPNLTADLAGDSSSPTPVVFGTTGWTYRPAAHADRNGDRGIAHSDHTTRTAATAGG